MSSFDLAAFSDAVADVVRSMKGAVIRGKPTVVRPDRNR